MKERSTTINFAATGGGGLTKAVNAVQAGVPYEMVQALFFIFDDSSSSVVKRGVQISNSNGVLKFSMTQSDFQKNLQTYVNYMKPAFYSDSSNTFTWKGKGKSGSEVSGTFKKEGNLHLLDFSMLSTILDCIIYGPSLGKVPVQIMFNGTVIQEYVLS